MQTLLCPTCGGHVQASDAVCGECGARLATEAAGGEVRRFATIVNSDLKGSTALGERLDPESLREVLTLYFDEMRAVFESHGGTIEKIIGDAIVAVFDSAVSHDDDALRAVVAAAESQRALASLNDRLERTWGVRLVVRTGIATGDVVFGEETLGQHVLTGDTMRISSAMEQHAPPLGVLVADSTYELVRDQVEVEPADPVQPKGMDVAVPAYVLLGVAEQVDLARSGDAARTGIRVCPACGEENPETFQLCAMCGASLDIVTPIRESRKTVTLVFADPKPTTLDGTPPSPEALGDVMTRYFDAMRIALEHHGGTVEKFIGDAVMAVYGLPVRHEDDAVRAVRAAADMQAALPALNDDFRATWGIELHNHIGVNTGEVIAGDASLGQRLVTGDAVNTAARLEQAAGAREIILGELTYRLARDHVVVEPIEPLTLKGKAEPVPAFRLLEVRDRPAERQTQATPFVGREAELARLREALEESKDVRACRLVSVIGDAGVGKSRLVREFGRTAGEVADVFRGRCLPYGNGITFWPIGEIVRSASEITADDDPGVAQRKIVALLEGRGVRGADALAIAERVASAVNLSHTTFQKDELFFGIRRLLEAMASQRPVVAVVDDVHVASPTFLELLDHLLEATRDAPILMLITGRNELAETHPEWSSAHQEHRLALGTLSSAEADTIVDGLLPGLDPGIRERILASAEGNPLFVEQIASMLVETGALQHEDGGWVAKASSDSLAIPPTVQALVAARLDALPVPERTVIEPASVIGYSFDGDALAVLVEAASLPHLPSNLDALIGRRLVRRATDVAELYRFNHTVIKDTTYGSLLKRVRAALHERFVDWAEPVNRERGREEEFEEILGYHLEQAYRYRVELGPADDAARALAARATEKLGAAGRRALRRRDWPAASGLLLRAAALLDADDSDAIEMLVDAVGALIGQGSTDRAAEVVSEAATAASRVGHERLQARVMLERAYLQLTIADPDADFARTARETEALIERYGAIGDDEIVARAWYLLIHLRGGAGQFEGAAEAARQTAEHARRIGNELLMEQGAFNHAFLALLGPSPVSEARAVCEALLMQVRGYRRAAESAIMGSLAVLAAMEGDFDVARSHYTTARRLLEELGPSTTASATSTESGRVELLAGDAVAAERELRRDFDALGAMGEQYLRSTIAGFLAEAVYRQGRYDDAREITAQARELSSDDDVASQMLWRTVEGKLLARDRDSDRAHAVAREALDLARQIDSPALLGGVLLDVGEVEVLTGRPEAAGPPWREALDLFERKGDRVSAARTRKMLASATSS